jgi:release factor glutamine methyltransferase
VARAGELLASLPNDPSLRRDARRLLAHLLGRKSPLSLDAGDPVSEEQAGKFTRLLSRLSAGAPLQYLLREWDFFGRTFRVDERALIPRPETEHLVEAALTEAADPRTILDLGCGSGILAITLALEFPRARVLGLDSSVGALSLSRENVRLHGVEERVCWLGSDWLSCLKPVAFDLVVANPPYVAEGDELPASVREFEPPEALFAGSDGLSEIRALLDSLSVYLTPGSPFLFEFGFGQNDAVRRAIAERPEWKLLRVVDDLAGIPRVAALRRA